MRKAGLVGRPTKVSIAEGDRLRHLELVTNAGRELDQVARPLSPSEGAETEEGAATRLDLIVRGEAPDDGRHVIDRVSAKWGVTDPVPPFAQHDVLHGKLGEPCLLENRTRSTRVEDFVRYAAAGDDAAAGNRVRIEGSAAW